MPAMFALVTGKVAAWTRQRGFISPLRMSVLIPQEISSKKNVFNPLPIIFSAL
jgi:hypothetical protein